MERIDVIHTLEVLKANCPKYLRDYQAFDYAISSLKTDLKYDLMYEGEEVYTKADMVAMLEELQLEINEAEIHRYDDQIDKAFNQGLHKGGQLIQLKINELKTESEDNNNDV